MWNATRAGLIGLLLLVASSPAHAVMLPDGGITVNEMAAVLRDKGYKAELRTDKDGDPMIRSAAHGVNFSVFFYECRHKPRCASIQFSAGFRKQGLDVFAIADWNRRFRFGKAYLDDENDPVIQMDVDVEHGVTTEGLANQIDRWTSLLPEFLKYIKW